MKPVSIYNALGIVEMATDAEARCALRRLLRLCYRKTRDNLGTTEESLRFYNQAGQILNDPERRNLYDQELALAKGTPSQRIDHVLGEVAKAPREPLEPQPNHPELPGIADISPISRTLPMPNRPPLEILTTGLKNAFRIPTLIPTVKMVFQTPRVSVIAANADDAARTPQPTQKETIPRPPPEPAAFKPTQQHYNPVLTESLALERSPVAQWLGAILILVVLTTLIFVSWNHSLTSFDPRYIWIWVPLLALAFFIGTAGLQRPATRIRDSFHLMTPPNEDAVKGWRRRNLVFLGSNQLTEDPSWVFQLRLAELERARVNRISTASPLRRAGARLFDYALWGWFLYFPLIEFSKQGVLSESMLTFIQNPLIAPVLITMSWVPIEALLTAAIGTTLGKWLFGIYVQFQVSNPYTSRSADACWRYAFARAARVWWQGAGMGFPPVFAYTATRALSTLKRYDETEWDSDLDNLQTYTPLKSLQTIGILGLAIMTLFYVVVWQGQFTKMMVTDYLPVLPANYQPSESEVAQQARLADFRQAILNASAESQTFLSHQDWSRALESCLTWAQLEITNPEPLRCQGNALQRLGRHQEAIAAFRRASIFAPDDASIDKAVSLSQEAIFRELSKR
jgi:hypothetical protein